ncbi:hypothetical protein [Aneurinibacillus aneurinilyticus]|jgi:hypothetical protein|uniref:hypothetical protein n=1 Tax=Aneurinibacillus aneurinilyticus TaxID=1391 RepID=UPI0023F9F53A|nr:hypothetical protein [Aneurinibacillus aneurinilyticus]MCI1696897.1 hypothetical protein [Aneurinibacillus aneurinilyticus]
MKHHFNTPVSVIRVTGQKDSNGIFAKRKPKTIGQYLCHIIKTETSEKLDEKPIIFVIKKVIGLPKAADIVRGDEISLLDHRYLVIDVVPRRYWKEIRVTCEVKGSEHS